MTLQEINARAEQIDKANPLSIDEMLKINLIKHKESLFNQAKKELEAEQIGLINIDKIIRENLN